MLDISLEKPLSLAEACQIIPPARNGRRTHISTVVRWLTVGAKGPHGERIRLEGQRLGGRWLTSAEAIGRFMERLTPVFNDDSADAQPAPRTPGQRQRASIGRRRDWRARESEKTRNAARLTTGGGSVSHWQERSR